MQEKRSFLTKRQAEFLAGLLGEIERDRASDIHWDLTGWECEFSRMWFTYESEGGKWYEVILKFGILYDITISSLRSKDARVAKELYHCQGLADRPPIGIGKEVGEVIKVVTKGYEGD